MDNQYGKEYDNYIRFISYFNQIELARKGNHKKILEAGIGNKTVTNYLKQQGYDVTTYDFDASLKPDVIGDIRQLPFKENEFDVVLAYEILEHIPFKDVSLVLAKLSKIAKDKVIISIPFPSLHFGLFLQVPYFLAKTKKYYFGGSINIPYFWRNFTYRESDGHFWELGTKNVPLSRFKDCLNTFFDIVGEYRDDFQPYHYYFELIPKLK